jgi:hypothetical protein
LDKDWVSTEDGENAPEHLEIVKAVRVLGRIVRHEEPEQNQDQVLKPA